MGTLSTLTSYRVWGGGKSLMQAGILRDMVMDNKFRIHPDYDDE